MKEGIWQKVLTGVIVSLLTVSIVGLTTTLTKTLHSEDSSSIITESSDSTDIPSGFSTNFDAFAILLQEDSWGRHNNGQVTSVKRVSNGLKIGGTVDSTNSIEEQRYSGFMLKLSAIEKLVDLGVKQLSFRIDLSADKDCILPITLGIYVTGGDSSYFVDPICNHIAGDNNHELFFKSKSHIILDIVALRTLLVSSAINNYHKCLKFVFSAGVGWYPTYKPAYVTFSEIVFKM